MSGSPRPLRAALGVAVALAVTGTTAVTVGQPAAATTVSAANSGTSVATYVVRVQKAPASGPLRGLGLDAQVRTLATLVGGKVPYVYRTVLRGAALTMPTALAPTLRSVPGVVSVRRDVRVAADTTQPDATWGLDRVDQAALPLDRSYTYPDLGGQGSHVYVIDTGINPNHAEFTGRVGASRNFVAPLLGSVDPNAWTDCNGHGTHVASTSAGTTWGVAKKATVHAVRVLDCQGSGSSSGILAGMDWVAANHGPNAVANMSLGTIGSRSTDIEAAAKRLVASGVALAVAAGNDSKDACTTSPAAEPAVLTTGATTKSDARASFSNFGTCVDLFAPGESITAADYSTTSGSTMLSGTSMASPHVAGALALVRAANPGLSAAQAQSAVTSGATPGKVTSPGTGSPNLLLRVSGGSTSPAPTPDPTPTPTAPCTSCTAYSGTLGAGASAYHPGTGGFTWSGGQLVGYLQGPATANLDAYLERRSCFLLCSWSVVASSTGPSSQETVSLAAASGTYRWRVTATSGSGAYRFWGQPR